MEMGAEDARYALPAELDTYIQDSIYDMLGLRSSEDYLKDKLSKAEESYSYLALQMQHLQVRIRELEHKYSKSKEEAVLNAQALKRQVAEGQKLTDQCRVLKEECKRLEEECVLYHNDRDVFMEATYEAEDRAAEAEDRAVRAEKEKQDLVEELERIQRVSEQENSNRSSPNCTESLASLKAQIIHLQEQNARLREEVSVLESGTRQQVARAPAHASHSSGDSEVRSLLLTANEQYEETSRELRTLQEAYARDVSSREDEQTVHEMVSSAINAGMCKALEHEIETSLSAFKLEFDSIYRRMDSELVSARQRADLAELNVDTFLLEVQALTQEVALCRGNLDKAEVEVQMLGDENKELRIMLRRKYGGCESPVQNKGNKGGRSQSVGRPHYSSLERSREESPCFLCKGRQPLMPLPPNAEKSGSQ